MVFQMMRVVCAAGVLSALKLEATSVSLLVDANIGTAVKVRDIHFFANPFDIPMIEYTFAQTVEFPVGSGQEHFFGATVEVDAETGGFRGKSNLYAVSQSGIVWGGRIDIPIEVFGPSGTILVPLDLTVRSNFSYDAALAAGARHAGRFEASLETSTPIDSELSAFVYEYSAQALMEPTLKTTPTGDVVIIEASRGYIEVILRTVLEVPLFSGRGGFQLDARVGGRLNALGGTGGAINAFDSAFLTLNLPPGYTLGPGPFLSKPFEQPFAVPEPWMAPLLGVVLTALAVWKRQRRLGR